MEVPEEIRNWITSAVKSRNADADEETANVIINDQLKAFAESDCQVYCKDCGIIFYFGLEKSTMLMDKRFLDWKMLAFRHAWDTDHTVKVASKFFTGANRFSLKVLASFGIAGLDGQFNYSKHVRKLKERYKANSNPRLHRSNDENWDAGSRCVCSTCGKSHYDPKEACYCCYGSKPWMPFGEVDTINVKSR